MRSDTSGVEALEWVMNEIVGGQEEDMATLACEYRRARSTATCPMRGCVWTIQTRGDTLSGIAERPSCRCQRSITWADRKCRT